MTSLKNKSKTPLKIIVKGIDIELSAEMAIRSHILSNLFELRNEYAPGFKFDEDPVSTYPSEIESLTIKIPSIEIIGKAKEND